MNIVVIGLGSMGKRRIRLLKNFLNFSINSIIGIDTNKDRRIYAKDEFMIQTYDSIQNALNNFNIHCAFVCSSPLSHNSIIKKCLENNLHVFSELNLVSDGYDYNINLANEKNKILFLSSTFLYKSEINKINTLVKKQQKKLNYIYHVGQYLPDWHPLESYKDFFVAEKLTNACREIFAIELPWIVYIFGSIKNIYVTKNKISNLDINYNDNYIVIFEHITGHKGTMTADIVSRKAIRKLDVFGEDLYLSWDANKKNIKNFNIHTKKEENIDFALDDAYYNEVEYFFDMIFKNKLPIYTFQDDKKILDIIDQIDRTDNING